MFLETKREGEAKTTTTPWRQVLLDVAAILEAHGWIKGQMHTSMGYCVIGGLRATNASDLDKQEAAVRLAMHLDTRSLAGWNDAHERTKEEVLTVLLRVANEKWEVDQGVTLLNSLNCSALTVPSMYLKSVGSGTHQ
jgi:hypothetical protein